MNKYRFSFNGQEKDVEVNPNVTTAKYWEYDGRTAHRWNIDPITFPWQSSYAVFNGNPIYYSDPLGLFGNGGNGAKKPYHNNQTSCWGGKIKPNGKINKSAKEAATSKWKNPPTVGQGYFISTEENTIRNNIKAKDGQGQPPIDTDFDLPLSDNQNPQDDDDDLEPFQFKMKDFDPPTSDKPVLKVSKSDNATNPTGNKDLPSSGETLNRRVNVTFNQNSSSIASITPQDRILIRNIASILKSNADVTILILGNSTQNSINNIIDFDNISNGTVGGLMNARSRTLANAIIQTFNVNPNQVQFGQGQTNSANTDASIIIRRK